MKMRMFNLVGRFGLTTAIALGNPMVFAKPTRSQKAHEHGRAKLSIVIDGINVLLSFESPSNNIFGFEHEARTAKQQQIIKDAMSKLRERSSEIFVFSSDLECLPNKIEVKSGQEENMKKNAAAPSSDKKEGDAAVHNDVDAEFAFTCKKSPVGTSLKLGLFQTFPQISKLEVAIVSSKGQSGKTASAADNTVNL